MPSFARLHIKANHRKSLIGISHLFLTYDIFSFVEAIRSNLELQTFLVNSCILTPNIDRVTQQFLEIDMRHGYLSDK